MEPYATLNLSMLSNVSTSYSNMWWSESLKESIEINKGFELKVLTELNLSLDTAMSQGRYIPFPTFREKVEPGFYHINYKGSNQMYSGFMHVVSDEEVFWWGTDASDRVYTGFVGHQDLIGNHHTGYRSEMHNWLNNITYVDKYKLGTDIFSILKPF